MTGSAIPDGLVPLRSTFPRGQSESTTEQDPKGDRVAGDLQRKVDQRMKVGHHHDAADGTQEGPTVPD